jgi:deoxyribose-phosphate aldolase
VCRGCQRHTECACYQTRPAARLVISAGRQHQADSSGTAGHLSGGKAYSRRAIGCKLRVARLDPTHYSDPDAPTDEETMPDFTYADIARMLDHSLLQQTLTDDDLERGCDLARTYSVASVCIKPYAVGRAAQILAGSGVAVGTVVGFPQGGQRTSIKVAESEAALDDGATELDMVVNIGKVLSKDWGYVRADVQAVVKSAHARRALVKVIFENCFLADEHKERLCAICAEVEADFVKTSTGYGDGGATDEDLRLMRKCSPPRVQVKAAGGVRTLDRLLAVRALGVTRVGATASRAILDEVKVRLGS